METKPCVKCGSTERYKPRPGKSSLGDCKVCAKIRGNKWNKNNVDKHRANAKAWHEKNPDRRLISCKTWRQAHPEKNAAHLAVFNAVRRKDLPRVSTCDCVDCGIQAAEYHHEDYSKPLDVEPLCRLCHTKRHNPEN